MQFDERVIEFGTVKKGEKREHTYRFTNAGDVPLEIDLVTSCDCTQLFYDEGKAYKPGEGGEIRAIFNSTEKEESETIDIDVLLRNEEPDTGMPIVEQLKYKFELKK